MDSKVCARCGKDAIRLLRSPTQPKPKWFCTDHAKEWDNAQARQGT